LAEPSQFATLTLGLQETSIEYQWINAENTQAPLMVFLHEGLGSVAMWKQFPQHLCNDLQCRGLVYSRPGYGQSSARAHEEKWDASFMHQQAYEVLPSLLSALSVDTNTNPPWLFGHSDGGSIALLYAAKYPDQLAGVIVLAPHIMVEPVTIRSIEQARTVYLETNLREKLGRYHSDVDSAFWGWNDIWLNPEFLDWNIEAELENIRCPLLAIQGLDDEYGSLQQIHGIKRRVQHAELLELAKCRHSPHKDQAETVISKVSDFIQVNTRD
jgi:pimeloyl-ACP methyl ester carboxylesterase